MTDYEYRVGCEWGPGVCADGSKWDTFHGLFFTGRRRAARHKEVEENAADGCREGESETEAL